MKKLLFTFLILFPALTQAQPSSSLDRVEPPFWWAGMTNPNLQLLMYGDNIANHTPSINYDGVTIDRVIRVQNPNYLFVDLKMEADISPGSFDVKLMNNGTSVAEYSYELKERREGSKYREGFNNSDVIYLITPDRFVNGDPSNDNHPEMIEQVDRSNPGGRHGGDIKGMLDNLDYLTDLGFTGIWVNPVLENNMETYSYHGYSTTDFYRVDPRFGTNEQYRDLSLQAKEKGVKMIMDMIVNHCGSEHWWMKDVPSSDWTNFKNTFAQTNHRKPTIQDPYRSEYDHKLMVDGWFVETMPDMNQRNPQMSTYLIQNSIWWVEYAELAGIRQDTYPYSDKDFLTRWSCQLMEEYPNFNITGEEWNDNPNILAYWQRGRDNHDGYESCLPSLLDFPLQGAMMQALTEEQGDWSGMIKLYRMLANDYIYEDPNAFVVFPDNHDMDRWYTQVNEDYGKFKNGIAYVLTTRGTPQIYYGTELLFTNATSDHGLIRKDYPGGWKGDKINAFTGKGLTDQQKDAREFISKIQNWRKNAEVIHNGGIKHFVPFDDVYVYFRMGNDEMVMVVINRSPTDRKLDLSRFSEVLQGPRTGRDILTDSSVELNGTMSLKANSPMIIEIKGF